MNDEGVCEDIVCKLGLISVSHHGHEKLGETDPSIPFSSITLDNYYRHLVLDEVCDEPEMIEISIDSSLPDGYRYIYDDELTENDKEHSLRNKLVSTIENCGNHTFQFINGNKTFNVENHCEDKG